MFSIFNFNLGIFPIIRYVSMDEKIYMNHKRQEVEKDLSPLKILVPNKKNNLQNYLYPLKKCINFPILDKNFAKFLAATFQEVKFYGTILK